MHDGCCFSLPYVTIEENSSDKPKALSIEMFTFLAKGQILHNRLIIIMDQLFPEVHLLSICIGN